MEENQSQVPPAFEYHSQPPVTPEQLEQNPALESKRKSKLLTAGGVVLALLIKFKTIIILVLTKLKFLLIFLKLGKFSATIISMGLTIWFYAMAFGFWYALGIVGLIFVHEMGHYWAAQFVGLPVSGPVFIPFVGAIIGMKKAPPSALVEAKVGYGGPLLGTAAALLALAWYWETGSHLAAALAYTGFIINLFNLIPIRPLDGGRIVIAISPYLWLLAIPVLLYLVFTIFNPLLILIIILGGIEAYKLWKNKDSEYYQLPLATKAVFALLYFGLIGLLGAGIWYTLSILGPTVTGV